MGRTRTPSMVRRGIFLSLVTLLLFPSFGPVSAAPEPKNRPRSLLSLDKALRMARERNFDVRLEALSPPTAAAETLAALAVFEASMTGNVGYADVRVPTGSALGGATVLKTQQFDYDLGITQKVLTGGRYDARWSSSKLRTNSFFASLNPSYASNFAVSVSQPLLRGFGVGVNKTGIQVARNNEIIARVAFRAKLIDVVSRVEIAYWNFAQAYEDLKTLESSKKVAELLVAVVVKRLKHGKADSVEESEAKADQAAAAERVIEQRTIVRNALDRLLNLIDPQRQSFGSDTHLRPETPPAVGKKITGRDRLERMALEASPELRQAEKRLENSEAFYKESKNGLLPQLDLITGVTFNGLGQNPGNSFDDVTTTRGTSYSVGFGIEIPLGNKAARSRARKAELEIKKDKIRIASLTSGIRLGVRESVRLVNGSVERMAAAKNAHRFAQATLLAIRKRLANGDATTRDLIEKREVAIRAGVRFNQAVIAYQKARARLAQATAQTLKRRNIRLGKASGTSTAKP